MEKRKSVPVLISFKQLSLSDTVVDAADGGKHIQSVKRKYLPIRSLSMCSLLSSKKKRSNYQKNTGKENFTINLLKAELEIERFENDFVFPALRDLESVKSCDFGSGNAILNVDSKVKVLHSSSDSINTDSDSGIFSRLSSTDRDSEDSDSSTEQIKKYSDGNV